MDLKYKLCEVYKLKGDVLANKSLLSKVSRQPIRITPHQLKGHNKQLKRQFNYPHVVDSNEGSHYLSDLSSPSKHIPSQICHHLNRMNCPPILVNVTLSKSPKVYNRAKTTSKSRPHPIKKPAITPKMASKSACNRVISTTVSSIPKDTNHFLEPHTFNPKGCRLFLYDPSGPKDSFLESSFGDISVDMSESILSKCMDSNPRDMCRPCGKMIITYNESPAPKDELDNTQLQIGVNKSGTKQQRSAEAEKQLIRLKNSEIHQRTENDSTARTLAMVDDNIFVDETPVNESSMTICLERPDEEGESKNRTSTKELPTIKMSTEMLGGILQANEIIIEDHEIPDEEPEQVLSLESAPSYQQVFVSGAIAENINGSNSNLEKTLVGGGNSHKTIWQRIFKRNAPKCSSKESDDILTMGSKAKPHKNFIPSTNLGLEKTRGDSRNHSSNIRNVDCNAPLKLMGVQASNTIDSPVRTESKANQTDYLKNRNKLPKLNDIPYYPPEPSKLFQYQSFSYRKAGFRSTTSEDGKLTTKTPKVISVEVSNATMTSEASDHALFAQVDKPCFIKNISLNDFEKPIKGNIYDEDHKPPQPLFVKSQASAEENVMDINKRESYKKKESKCPNLEIKPLQVNTISPPNNYIDTTEEDDPFLSEHFSSVFTTKDSLELCTWVEKQMHSKISDDKTSSRRTDLSTETQNQATTTRFHGLIHSKDSLEMYDLGGTNPNEKTPFKKEFKFLIKPKRKDDVQSTLRGHEKQPRLQPQKDFGDVVDEISAQFKQLKRQNSNFSGGSSRRCEHRQLFEDEQQNMAEHSYETDDDDSSCSNQNQAEFQQVPELIYQPHVQEETGNGESLSFPKVKVFVTSPESPSHTLISESSHISPISDRIFPSGNASSTNSPQFVVIPSSPIINSRGLASEQLSTFTVGQTNAEFVYQVFPNQAENQFPGMQKQYLYPGSFMTLNSAQCECPVRTAETKLKAAMPVNENRLHSSEVSKTILVFNLSELEPVSPDRETMDVTSLQDQPQPNYSPTRLRGHAECENFRKVQGTNYVASGEGTFAFERLPNQGNFHGIAVNVLPKLMECTQHEVGDKYQIGPHCAREMFDFTQGFSTECITNPSSVLSVPTVSYGTTNPRFLDDVLDSSSSAVKEINAEKNVPRNCEDCEIKQSEAPHSRCGLLDLHRCINENKKLDGSHHGVAQSKNLFTLSTFTSSHETQNFPETVFINGNQVRNSADSQKHSSMPADQGWRTEVEVVGIDDTINEPGDSDRIQKVVLIEKISDSLVSFLDRRGSTETNLRNERADRELSTLNFSVCPKIKRDKSDQEVSTSVSGFKQADQKAEWEYQEESCFPKYGSAYEKRVVLRQVNESTAQMPISKENSETEIMCDAHIGTHPNTTSGCSYKNANSSPRSSGYSHSVKISLDEGADETVSKKYTSELTMQHFTRKTPAHNDTGMKPAQSSCTNSEGHPQVSGKVKSGYFANRGEISMCNELRHPEKSDISDFQKVVVASKDSFSPVTSSAFQALNVEVKANPAWLCQGMSVRAMKTRKENGYLDEA